jgi:hypothetical protein
MRQLQLTAQSAALFSYHRERGSPPSSDTCSVSLMKFGLVARIWVSFYTCKLDRRMWWVLSLCLCCCHDKHSRLLIYDKYCVSSVQLSKAIFFITMSSNAQMDRSNGLEQCRRKSLQKKVSANLIVQVCMQAWTTKRSQNTCLKCQIFCIIRLSDTLVCFSHKPTRHGIKNP